MDKRVLHGLANRAFTVHYQPVVFCHNHSIFEVEALVRWHHDGSVLYPGQFVQALESGEVGERLGEQVLARAVEHILRGDLQRCAVAVNIAAVQFQSPYFLRMLERLSAELGPLVQQLHLEVPEWVLLQDLRYSEQRIQAWRNLGVKVTLDDFGSSHVNVSVLDSFEVDCVKIDRTHTRYVEQSVADIDFVRAVTSAAQSRSLRVVAKGVEGSGQSAMLCDLGCHALQGYYFYPPLPFTALQSVLDGRSNVVSFPQKSEKKREQKPE